MTPNVSFQAAGLGPGARLQQNARYGETAISGFVRPPR
jgi:hypothetical protein